MSIEYPELKADLAAIRRAVKIVDRDTDKAQRIAFTAEAAIDRLERIILAAVVSSDSGVDEHHRDKAAGLS